MNTAKIEAEYTTAQTSNVDRDFETLSGTLAAAGLTPTATLTYRATGLYARKTEGSREVYIGGLTDPDQAREWANEWFERNGAGLPE